MAAKTKSKTKAASKPIKKVATKAGPVRKSSVSSAKRSRPAAPKVGRTHSKSASSSAQRRAPAVEFRSTAKGRQAQTKSKPVISKPPSKEHTDAIHLYESGLKAMHAEEYDKAIKAFRELISRHAEEPEIQERARVLMQAAEKKRHEKSRTVLRSADDHYNMGIAELNRRQLDAAAQHLQHALKLAPKGDHILYAMAAVNALKGNRDDALTFLKQSIHHRPENRFMAARDSDFEALIEDADCKHLVTSAE